MIKNLRLPTSYIVYLAGRTKVLAWFHLLSFSNCGYERTPIRQTTPYTRNVGQNSYESFMDILLNYKYG